MRFFEFGTEGTGVDKLVTVLRNYIGRAKSQKVPTKLNWMGLNRIISASGLEMAADYETFQSLYDTNPVLQTLVKTIDDSGVELNIPGLPGEEVPAQSGETPADAVAATAAGAVDQQLDQYTKGVQA